jgi:hypothetical protein
MAGIRDINLDGGLNVMSAYILTDVGSVDGDSEVARSTVLFFEADRLDELAYSILDTDDRTDDILKKFTEAKAIADATRAEASLILTHLRQHQKL